jgi:zinc protease
MMSARLEAVDSAAVSAAARAVIDPDKATLVVVGEAEKFLDDLKRLRDDIEVIGLDELDISSPTLRKAKPK